MTQNIELKDPLQSAGERDRQSLDLVAHIQNATEQQKALLARELHDDLGGLLVGAVMDLAWAEHHLSAPPAELKLKLTRARQTLSAAIDLKRKLIEDLRPTLLDNVGLFAALRWHVQAMCKRAGIVCDIKLPDEETRFLPNIPIALFRIVQECYAVIVARQLAASSDFALTINRKSMTIQILIDAVPSLPGSRIAVEAHAMSAIEHRTTALGGKFEWLYTPAGGVGVTATFPLHTVLYAA